MSESIFLDPFAQPPSSARTGNEAADRQDREPWSFTVVIPMDAERVAEAFLDYIHLWWPAELRACGPDSHLGFEEGALLEEGVDGARHRWAEVVGTEGASLSLRWWGGSRGAAEGGRPMTAQAAEVSLTFASHDESAAASSGPADEPEGHQALLSVRGSGAPEALEDWTGALTGFARFTGGTVTPDRP